MRQPPVLTTEEMLQLASKNPTNDILDFEELCTGNYNSTSWHTIYIHLVRKSKKRQWKSHKNDIENDNNNKKSDFTSFFE